MGEWERRLSGADDLHRRLSDFQDVLATGAFLPLPEEERHALWRKARDLEEKLRRLEDGTLLMGLVGGTGVGKSTLMNALAQEPIASVSHRRPHTDRVLIYRHVQCPVPQALRRGEGLLTEVTHQADGVRQVIMADLPDFDSLVPEHRARVLAFLEHLDLVLWVSTPEKYADGRFYEMLREAPKARRNFVFVLNKADIFFPDSGSSGALDDLNAVVRSFRRLVREAGVHDPVFYVVSAREALSGSEPSSWNQFPFLRRWVFQERDAKEIRAIKEANLDAEFYAVAGRLHDGVLQLEKAVFFLDELATSARDERRFGNWAPLVRGVLSPGSAQGILWQSLENPEDLRGAAALLSWLARLGAPSSRGAYAGSTFAEEVSSALEERFQHHVAGFREFSATMALQAAVAEPLKGELLERLNRSLETISVADGVREAVTAVLGQVHKAGDASWRRRQRFATLFFTALLLLALGGQDGWRAVVSHPDPATVIGLSAAIVEKLFSGQGLAALGTWAFLQLGAGARFYREYKKSLQRRGEAIIDSLQSALEDVLRHAVEKHLEVVHQCRKEMEDRRHRIGRILQTAPGKDGPVS